MVDIIEVLRTWSFWDHEPPHVVPRAIRWPNQLREEIAIVVTGVRRCGKSTLQTQFLPHYRLDRRHCAFINFEDPRLINQLTYSLLDEAVSAFRKFCGPGPRLYFFFDEIQLVSGFERWLRSQLERPKNCSFVITGSNAQLLAGEMGGSLTGRYLPIELFPFSLDETKRAIAETTVESYLQHGGFPAPVLADDGDVLLRQYFIDIVERDIRERVASRSSKPLLQLLQMAFEGAGSETSVRRLASAVGIAVETAQNYLDATESAYLLFGCQFFAYSERKRASHNKKYYPVDVGLRRVVVTKTGSDRGKALEIATYIALRRTFPSVYYWRKRGEVDFVAVSSDGAITPVQVSWDGATERHLKALDEFYEEFPQSNESITIDRHSFATDQLTYGGAT